MTILTAYIFIQTQRRNLQQWRSTNIKVPPPLGVIECVSRGRSLCTGTSASGHGTVQMTAECLSRLDFSGPVSAGWECSCWTLHFHSHGVQPFPWWIPRYFPGDIGHFSMCLTSFTDRLVFSSFLGVILPQCSQQGSQGALRQVLPTYG